MWRCILYALYTPCMRIYTSHTVCMHIHTINVLLKIGGRGGLEAVPRGGHRHGPAVRQQDRR